MIERLMVAGFALLAPAIAAAITVTPIGGTPPTRLSEPSTIALLGLTVGAIAGARWYKGRKKK